MSSNKHIWQEQKSYFESHTTKDLDFRLKALNKLHQAIKTYESEIVLALHKDLNKSEFESYATEIGIVLEEIKFVKKRLRSWMKRKKLPTSLTHIGTCSYQYPEPYGVVLIISPWNYPFQLALLPLVGAIAAGNCTVIKPSELTPTVSKVICSLIGSAFDSKYIAVVEGGVDVSEELLSFKFDYIFFTGSVQVGRIVMQAAAQHLIPLTLELGGKSPCIVDKSANLVLSAKRIAWGKFLNAGQTCVAPDYLLVDQAIQSEFLKELTTAIIEMYSNEPLKNTAYTRIVSAKHFDRLVDFITQSKDEVIHGGKSDRGQLKIEPTIINNVCWNDSVMKEEIFGPILPILAFENLDEAISQIKNSANPLALYVFSENKNVVNRVISEVPFGGGCINDTVYHTASSYLPFGGRGESGMGAYHGKKSFDTFTHYKTILIQNNWFDIPFRYPNYKNALKYLKMFIK